MNSIKTLILLHILFLAFIMNAQNAYIEHSRYIGVNGNVSPSPSYKNRNAIIYNDRIYSINFSLGATLNTTNGTTVSSGLINMFLMVTDTLGNIEYLTSFEFSTGSNPHVMLYLDNGDIYITGQVEDGVFPSTNGTAALGQFDGFIIKFSENTILSNGNSYDYAAYFGGSDWDEIVDLEFDTGSVYYVMNTSSINIPTTNGSFFGGIGDLYIGRLDNQSIINNQPFLMNTLDFGSYFGGSEEEYSERDCMGMENGHMYVAFNVAPNNSMPVTNGSIDLSVTNGYSGAVLKVSDITFQNDLQILSSSNDYASYINTDDDLWIEDAIFENGMFLIVGGISGNNIPTTVGTTQAHQNYSGFLCVFNEADMNSNAAGPTYYVVSEGNDYSYYTKVRSYNGSVYVSGEDESTNLISTDGSTTQNSSQGFVREYSYNSINTNSIDPDDILFYVGGSLGENIFLLEINQKGIHVNGITPSPDFNTTNSTQPFGGSQNNFYANYCFEGYQNYGTVFSESNTFSPQSLLPYGNSVYFTGVSVANNYTITNPLFGSNMFIPSAPTLTKVSFQDSAELYNDTLFPMTQDVCQYGTPQLLEGYNYLPDNSLLPILYNGTITTNQYYANYLFQWQISNTAGGPWSNISGAILSDYLPVVATTDQYYRRQVMLVQCADTIVLSISDVAEVLVNNNLAPVADAGGTFHTCPNVPIIIGGTPSATNGTAPYVYEWDFGLTNVANPTATTAQNTIYTLTITDALGCEHSDQAVVYVHQANAGVDIPSCAGQPASIGGSPIAGLPGVTYSWSPASNLSCINCAQSMATPSASQVYTLLQTIPLVAGGTCQTSDQVTVTPILAPSNAAFAGPDVTLCFGTTGALGSAPEVGFSYNWYPGIYIDDASSSSTNYSTGNLIFPNPDPTHYYVVASSQGCEFMDEVDVYTINASAGQDGCGPRTIGTADKTPNFNETYNWTLVSGPGVITGPTNTPTTTVSASVGGPSVYQLTVTFNGVTCTDQVVVSDCGCTQFEIESQTPTGCPSYWLANDSITLTAGNVSSQSGLIYSWSPNVGLSSYTSQTVTLQTNVSSTYMVEITDPMDPGFYCTQFIDVNMPNWSIPSFNEIDTIICAGNSVDLGGVTIPNYSYEWNYQGTNFNNTSNPNVSPNIAGVHNYNVTIEDSDGCIYNGTSSVTIEEVVFDAGGDWLVCENAIIQLGESNDPNLSYSWEPALSPWQNGTTQNSAQPEVIMTTSVQFTVTATGLASGCNAYDTVEVIVDNLPSIDPFPDSQICLNDFAVIGNPPINGVSSYSWTPSTGLSCTNCAQPVASPSVSTNYEVTLDFLGNCTAIPTDDILVTVLGSAFSMPDITYCPSDGPVNIGVNAPVGATYSWSPASLVSVAFTANPTTNVTQPTMFVLTVGDFSGCSYSDTIMVSPSISGPDAGSNQSICLNNGSVIIGNPSNTGILNWSPTTNLSTSSGATNVFTPSSPGQYVFTLSQSVGTCTISDQVEILVNDFSIPQLQNQFVCQNNCVNIGSTSVPGISYSWTPAANLSNSNSANPVACPTSSTVYTLTAIGPNGCVSQQDVSVSLSDSISPTITIPNLNLCISDPATSANVSISPPGNYTYQWNPSLGLSSSTIISPNVTPLNNGFQTYNISAVDQVSGCQSTATLNVNVSNCVLNTSCDIPFDFTIFEDTICTGETIVVSFNSDSSNVTYTWTTVNIAAVQGNTNGTGSQILHALTNTSSILQTITYQVTPDINGCSGDPQTVIVYVAPQPDVLVNGSIYYCEGDSALLNSNYPLDINVWSTGSIDSVTYATSIDNLIFLQVSNVYGCTGIDSVNVIEQPITSFEDTLSICQGDSLLIHGIYRSLPGDYLATLQNNGCDSIVTITLEVIPLPNVIFTIARDTICSSELVDIALSSDSTNVTFSWTTPNLAPTIQGNVNGAGSQITQNLINSSSILQIVTYQVTPTFNGCLGPIYDAVISVAPIPTNLINGSNYYCEGDSTLLTSLLPLDINTWSTGSVDFITYANSIDSPVFLEVINQFGCVGLDSIVINEQAIVIYYDTLSICDGDSLMILGSYRMIPGDYTDTLISNGCDSIVNIHLIVNPLPIIQLTALEDTLCPQDSLFLAVTGASVYSWNAFPTADSIINTVLSSSQMIQLEASTSFGCSLRDSLWIEVLPIETAYFDYNDTLFCSSGGNIIPNFIGNTGSFASGSVGLVIDAATGEIDLVSSALGYHLISYTTNGLCPFVFDTTISIVASPDASFYFDDTLYCMNGNAPIINNTGSSNLFFANPVGLQMDSTTGFIDLTVSLPGEYTITGEANVSGCPTINFDTTIHIYEAPNVIVDSIFYVCDSLNMPFVEITLNGVGPWELTYQAPSGNITTINVVSSPYIIPNLTFGEYNLLAINDLYCSQTLNFAFRVLFYNIDGVLPLSNYITCSLQDLSIVNFESNSNSANISWFTSQNDLGQGSGASGNMGNINLFNQTSLNDTTIIGVFNEENGCFSDTSYFEIVVFPNIIPEYTYSDSVGCLPFTFTLESQNNISCQWLLSNGVSSNNCNDTFTLTTESCVNVQLISTDVNGCNNTIDLQHTFCAFENPDASFDLSPESTTLLNPEVLFNNNSTNTVSQVWSVDGLEVSTDYNTLYTFSDIDTATYNVCLLVNNQFGCLDSTCLSLIVGNTFSVYIPNSFTPDGNLINDFFGPVITGNFSDYRFMIFDRWGLLIFETDNHNILWNGSYLNVDCLMDVYVWKLQVKDIVNKKYYYQNGHVTLIR